MLKRSLAICLSLAASSLGVVACNGTGAGEPSGVAGASGGGGAAGGSPAGGGGAAGSGSGGTAGGSGGFAGDAGAGGGGGTGGAGGAVGAAGSAGGASGSFGGAGATAGASGAAGGRGAAGGAGGRGTAGGSGGAVGMGGTGAAAGGVSGATGALIENDRFWKDSSGTPIYSQGGGVLQVGSTYYWYGVKYQGAVSYAASPTKKNSDTTFAGVTIYSSTDLVNWKLENTVTFSNAGGWFGRLGVVYNAISKKYVLVAQGGGGLYFATSDTPAGAFTFNNVQTNLPGIVNGSTGDQTTFQDDDGTAYLVSSSSSGRAHRYVSPLRAADFLAAENALPVYSGTGREGNCMFKYAGTYYFCSSDLHGWNASQTYCVSASSLKGPWSAEFVLDGTGADFSHVTQTGFFVSVKGSQQTTIIFAGDRWSDFAGNGVGFNQWMPLTFTGTTPHIQSLTEWSIDATTGAWGLGPANNYVLNPTFEADRVAVTAPAGWTTSNGTNVNGGHTGNWAWQLTGTASVDQVIPNLPNGTYALSVWVKSSAAGAQLYAKGFGGTDKTLALPAAGTWINVTISGIAVSNGHCDVGLTAGGQTVTLDDFVLSRT